MPHADTDTRAWIEASVSSADGWVRQWGRCVLLILELVLLLIIANGAPIIVKDLLGERWARPVDGHRRWRDGRPLLGPTKTVRGVASAIAATGICGVLLGFAWPIGFVLGSGAMLGDLLASFAKRRIGKPPSSRSLGLDQVPESLLPTLLCQHALSLTAMDVVAVVLLFVGMELFLSKLLYKLHVRDRPY